MEDKYRGIEVKHYPNYIDMFSNFGDIPWHYYGISFNTIQLGHEVNLGFLAVL